MELPEASIRKCWNNRMASALFAIRQIQGVEEDCVAQCFTWIIATAAEKSVVCFVTHAMSDSEILKTT